MAKEKPTSRYAFTLIEMLIAICILAILVGISVSSLRAAKLGADREAAQADAKTFNEAIRRVEISDTPGHWATLSNIIHVQKDGPAAIQWIISNNYVQP
jgi:prepilin-type N-terminal cleavage/methylation domain-containing protein